MKTEWTIVIGLLVTVVLLLVWVSRSEGRCYEPGQCLPTFCARDSECPPGCFCAVPFGEVTGECS